MFSNLSQNSILYILDLKNSPKVLSGPVERISIPRPKYNTFNPNMEMVVDITATVNSSLANFGDDAFVLAESKDVLNSYINAMLQNSRSIINSIEKHQKLVVDYEEALQELNPDIKASKENDKAIQSLQDQVDALQKGMQQMLAIMTNKETPKT